MELKHLRKNKIRTISTQMLENELAKLEARQTKYEKDITDNESLHKILQDRVINSGEGTDTYRFPGYNNAEWSRDKYDWVELNEIIRNAQHALVKMQKKKDLIEIELTERILTGYL